jgi:hypothetical protein
LEHFVNTVHVLQRVNIFDMFKGQGHGRGKDKYMDRDTDWYTDRDTDLDIFSVEGKNSPTKESVHKNSFQPSL